MNCETTFKNVKKKFAWLPKKLTDGTWVWLDYYEHTTIKKPRPMIRAMYDKDYIHTIFENMKKYNDGN